MTSSRGPAIAMFLVAAFEFVLGVVFLAISTVMAEVRVPFLVVGGILAAGSVLLLWIGLRFNRRYVMAQALRANGVRGAAQVLAARQTGVTLNEQPQVALDLRITAPGHGTYDATVKEYVPLIALGMLGSGHPLTVLVDPQDRTRFVVEWSLAAPTPFGAPSSSSSFGGSASFGASAAPADPAEQARIRSEILATGIPGTARVLSAEFAGSLDEQSRPIYAVQLHIQVEGRAPSAGPAVFAVPLERVSVMQPGGVIPIKADAYDPRKFAADWDRLPAS